jgi:hypothetical protein
MGYKTYGRQVIDHSLRNSLKTTCAEYCLLMHIYDWCHTKKMKKLVYNRILFDHVKKNLGFSYEDQAELCKSLIEKGFFTRIEGVKNRFIRNPISYIHFQPSQDNFEELWKFYGKVGNKQKALDAYNTCVREYPHEFLLERVERYLEHLEITDQLQMHMSTFLNVRNKEFLNEFKRKKQTGYVKGNFFQ